MCRARLKAFAGARIHFLNCFSPNTLWFSSSSLLCLAAWQPWPSLWHLVSCELSHSLLLLLLFSLSLSLSQPFTHSLHGLLWLCLCVSVCVFGAYVCIISAAIRAASASTSCSPSFLLPLPLLGFHFMSHFHVLLFFFFVFFMSKVGHALSQVP